LVTLSYILISYFTILLNPLDYAVLWFMVTEDEFLVSAAEPSSLYLIYERSLPLRFW
jgi:hypothetical protein